MQLFRFDKELGKDIQNYNSEFAIYSRIIKTSDSAQIGCIYIEPNGVVGYHEAPVPQLFLIVQGQGWVTSENREKVFVTQGECVFWEKGEGHESSSDIGMTAIVIESPTLDPAFMLSK
jgi:quercetin dioxygenase-like cupin family protein